MKKLQNNFTTPEQSKRLLELGVPANSADCVLENLDTAEDNFQSEDYTRWIIEERHVKEDIFCERNEGIFLPCWSVSRLMEIFEICDALPAGTENNMCSVPSLKRMSYMEYMMKCFAKAIEMKILDFSKLEE